MPIIKCEIRVGKAGEYAAVDISMGAANGTEAAEFIAQEVSAAGSAPKRFHNRDAPML